MFFCMCTRPGKSYKSIVKAHDFHIFPIGFLIFFHIVSRKLTNLGGATEILQIGHGDGEMVHCNYPR